MKKAIFINQIGYSKNSAKYAYVNASELENCNSFVLLDKDNNPVYEGKLTKPLQDEITGLKISCCDFSDFNNEGSFTISVGNQKSDFVKIGNGLYNNLYFSILRYFYLSRCGDEIVDSITEKWGHVPCHTSEAEVYGTKEPKTVIGGWHDAGDYGRYIVAGSKAVMDLLLAYKESKSTFKDFDILDEVRFELEWMLQMQREDGGVYHKISCYHFCGFILPEKETDKIVISPVSTAATCDFAGCLAFAYDFYKDKDSEFAEKLLSAAIKAENYAESHNDEIFSNPPEITTGSYGDWNVSDERYFALCSLFAATKDKSYLEKALNIRTTQKNKKENYEEPWKRNWSEGFGWGSVGAYGTEILLNNQNLIEDKTVIEDLKEGILSIAERLLANSKNASFGLSLTKIFWGSNGAACDESHMLLLAYDITGNIEYFNAARKNVDYVLGCNPLDLCYVSGNGYNSPKNPHHRQSGFLKDVMPGMLSGGPSAGLQDDVARKYLQGKSPLMCYIDDTGSYSTNEVAIYWNSPLVYAIAKLNLL